MTDLYLSDATSRKYWGAALDGRVLVTAWGRLGATAQTKTLSFEDADRARAECEKLVAAKRKGGYRDARPRVGELAFIADDHEHTDVVYVDDGGRLVCAACRKHVERVRVGKAPPRTPPRPATTTRPKKQESTTALKRVVAKLERQAWKDSTTSHERDELDRRSQKLQSQIDAIDARNIGETSPAIEMRAVPAISFQADFLWPLATELEEGARLSSKDVLQRVTSILAKSDLGKRVSAKLRASERPVWRAAAKTAKKASIDRVGGAPDWLGEEQWPLCNGCGAPMVFVGQLSAGPNTAIPLSKGRRIYLFACAEHCYEKLSQGVVVQPNVEPRRTRDKAADRVVLPKLELSFERGVEGREPAMNWLPNELERTAASLLYRETSHPRSHSTKVGGFPNWIQEPHIQKCPTCKQPMAFTAQLDPLMHASLSRHDLFGDGGSIYLFLCVAHERGHVELQSC